MDEDTGPVEDWDGDPVEEITEEQLAEILACWDRLVTPDMAAGARLVDLPDVEESASTAEPLDVYLKGSDPVNADLPPDDLFAAYEPDDDSITPLGRLLYGVKPTPDPDEDQPDPH